MLLHMVLSLLDPVGKILSADVAVALLKGTQAALAITAVTVAMAYAPYIWDNWRDRQKQGFTWLLIFGITGSWWAQGDNQLLSSLIYMFTYKDPLIGPANTISVTGRLISQIAMTVFGTIHLASALRRKYPVDRTFMCWSLFCGVVICVGVLFG